MSVRVDRRGESKAQYVYDAYRIYGLAVDFVSRIAPRYKDVLKDGIMTACHKLVDNVISADGIRETDEVRTRLREEHLLEARAAIDVMNVELTVAFDLLIKNPQGVYLKTDGVTAYSASEAKTKMEAVSQSLGELMYGEKEALSKLISSKKRAEE